MEKERMKEIVQEKYDFYVNEMHENLGNTEERWNMYLKCSGMLDLAQEMGCIDLVEYIELMDDLMKERANDKPQSVEEQLPFVEIPEENILPFPPEELAVLEQIEEMRIKICKDPKLNMIFLKMFDEFPTENCFVSAILCDGGYLMYQKNDLCFFIRITYDGKGLEFYIS